MTIETSFYFFVAYLLFWFFPMVFVVRLFSQTKNLEQKLEQLKTKLEN